MLRGSTIPLGLRTPVRLPLPSSPATDSPASLPSSSQSPKYDNRIVTPRMFPRDSDAYYPSDVETQHSSAPHSERNALRVPPTPSDLSGFSDAEQFGGSGYGTLSDAEMEPSDVEGDHRGLQALDLEEINLGSVPRPGWIFGGSPGHSHEALNETVHGTVVHQTGSVKLDSPIRTIQEPFPSVDQVAAETRSPKGTPVSPGSSPSPRRPATSSGSLQGSGLKEDNMKTFVYSPGSPPSIKQDTSSPRALASPRSVLLSPSSPRPRTISSSMQQGSASNSPRTLSASLQASLTSARGGSPGSIKAGTPRSPPKPLGIPQSPAPRDHVLGESRLRSSSRSTTDLRSANVTSGRPRESSRSPSAGISVDLPEWASDGSPASEGGLSPGRTSRSRKLSSPLMNGSLSSRVPSSPVRPAYHDQSPYQSPLASPTANPQQLSADDSVVITSEVNAGSSTAVQSPPRNTASIALERSFSMGYDNVAIEANPTPKQQRSEDPLASKFKSLLNNQEAAQMALVQAMTSGRNQSMVSARMALVTARDQLRMFRDMHPEYKDRTE
ncbi:hypothetical protein FRC02_012420 [Tulasnella sp. 418]|nr:hypothetical protein FRC02_012420 [Tulasnella sp. 418]